MELGKSFTSGGRKETKSIPVPQRLNTAQKIIKTSIPSWDFKKIIKNLHNVSEVTAVKPHCYLMLQCLYFIHLQNDSTHLFHRL